MKFLPYGLAAVGAVYFLYRLLQAGAAAAKPSALDRRDARSGAVGGDGTYIDTSSSYAGDSHHGPHAHGGSTHHHGDVGTGDPSSSDHGGWSGGSDTGFDSGGGDS